MLVSHTSGTSTQNAAIVCLKCSQKKKKKKVERYRSKKLFEKIMAENLLDLLKASSKLIRVEYSQRDP